MEVQDWVLCAVVTFNIALTYKISVLMDSVMLSLSSISYVVSQVAHWCADQELKKTNALKQ